VGDQGYLLGIDFGTSTTVAVTRWPDGRVRPVLVDGSPLFNSAVCVDDTGALLTGRDAVHSGRSNPAGFEPHPKRRIDEGTVLLRDREVPVPELIAAVLGRVVLELRRTVGQPPSRVVLTYPADWGNLRRGILLDAARRAGLGTPELVAEPVAAAAYFCWTLGGRLPDNGALVVYDFGAGTFDASVVRRTGRGFEVLASEGRVDVGGLDIDAAVVGAVGASFAGTPAWQRLNQPTDDTDRRARWALWQDVQSGKEMLSRTSATQVHVPLVEREVPLVREELERLAGPIVQRTLHATGAALEAAGVAGGDLAAIFLVGGSSRIPLVATALHRTFGIAPTVTEQPQLVVAEGSLRAIVGPATAPVVAPTGPVRPGPARPPTLPPLPTSPLPVPVTPAPRRRGTAKFILAAVAAVVVLAAGVVGLAAWAGSRSQGGHPTTAASSRHGWGDAQLQTFTQGWHVDTQPQCGPMQAKPSDKWTDAVRCFTEPGNVNRTVVFLQFPTRQAAQDHVHERDLSLKIKWAGTPPVQPYWTPAPDKYGEWEDLTNKANLIRGVLWTDPTGLMVGEYMVESRNEQSISWEYVRDGWSKAR
jgi:actin-like ATPase involved in cell morphogenesis